MLVAFNAALCTCHPNAIFQAQRPVRGGLTEDYSGYDADPQKCSPAHRGHGAHP